MKPPDNAPLPWAQDADYPADIVDAKNIGIGEFYECDKAAYAVAAANALPGLVEACRGLLDGIRANDGMIKLSYGIKHAEDALAALPGEVRTP